MSDSDCYLWAIGVIFWYKRSRKYYLCDKAPKLPFESWGAFYIFDKRFDQLELRRKKPKKGQSHYQWVTKEQILKRLEKDDEPK